MDPQYARSAYPAALPRTMLSTIEQLHSVGKQVERLDI